MNGDAVHAAPHVATTWRDVYVLVRDTREDVLEAVSLVDAKLDTVQIRVGVLEEQNKTKVIVHTTEKRWFGYARSAVWRAIALAVSFSAIAAYLHSLGAI